MLTIRLSRIGKKNKPMYRLIISEKARDPYGRALEILGSYNPYTKELQAKADRINYWLSQGSGISPTVNNLLISKNIIKGEKVKASKAREKKKKEEAPAGSPPEAKKLEPEKKEEKAQVKTDEEITKNITEKPEMKKQTPVESEKPKEENKKEEKENNKKG